MSSRALRRLRQEQEGQQDSDSSGDEYESEEDEQEDDRRKPSSFAFMMDDSDSDSESDSDDDDDDDNDASSGDESGEEKNEDGQEEQSKLSSIREAANEDEDEVGKEQKLEQEATKKDAEEDEEEDFDAILSEFQDQVKSDSTKGTAPTGGPASVTHHSIILHNNDPRDYDLDYTLRNMLNGTTKHNDKKGGSGGGSRKSRSKKCLFAQPRENWGKRPSSFVGGGLGMKLLTNKIDGGNTSFTPPWPYNDESLCPSNIQQWYIFDRSNTYASSMNDYDTYIRNSGDINALAMFIADNPFIVEPMSHLSMFFFSIGENERGIDLLKRLLWVMECAAHTSLIHGYESAAQVNLMEYKKDENETFFSTLFRLAKTSCMLGCVATSLAISRFLLSLDPLMDPCGILLVMDYYALATREDTDVEFLIDVVESDVVKICYKDGENHVVGEIRDMPNWSYSYAIALYRKSLYTDDYEEDDDGSNENIKAKADEALRCAIRRFPSVIRHMLEKNNVNVTGRSFDKDWPTVLGPLAQLNYSSNTASVEKIISIFIERNHKLWSGDDILKWMYSACKQVSEEAVAQKNLPEEVNATISPPSSPSPALDRYRVLDPMDFQDSFRRIPVDANPLDPGLMDAALNYTPNRRRFLRLNRRGGGGGRGGDDEGGIDLESIGRQQLATLLGRGRDGMEVIDPDLPLAELLWRSMLPWARVEGVPPGPGNR